MYREHPFGEVGERRKSSLGEIDVLRADSTTRAGVDDAHKHALLG